MNETQALLELIGKHWGFEVGNKIKTEIATVVGATNIDMAQLQSAIATIQGILDANPNTAQFDVGQNIVTQLTNHLTRITNLEGGLATLNGNASTVGSVAYAVKQESDRALASEATLQAGIDANTASIATLNGDVTVIGSVAKIAQDTATQASTGAVATAKAYADATFVTKADITAIDAVALSSMFRKAMDCAFSGATIADVLNGTGACASTTSTTTPPAGGTGAVI